MFGNQLAMLSLLLVGLSLSGLSNLSEAQPSTKQLQNALKQSTDLDEVHAILVQLGGTYKVYADLAKVDVAHCTPERILFRPNVIHMELGPGFEHYIATVVMKQQELCEDTFIERIIDQYSIYLQNWDGKGVFQQYLGFVEPWPTVLTVTDQTAQYAETNIQSYIQWRKREPPKTSNELYLRFQLIESCRVVHNLLGSFLASFRTGRPFWPPLGDELQFALMLGKIAEDAIIAEASRIR